MAKYEHAVFISYAWGAEREEIVNEIEKSLQERGVKIVRDKRTLGYRGSIKEFMERIGEGNCVIVVISDKYLRSPNCMFELVEIAENKQFHDRVFPIVLSDANIYDPVKRVEYVKHWETKLAELADAMRTVGPANLKGIRDEMDQYDRIRDEISEITSILKDMNTLTPDMHRDSNFSELYVALMKRMEEQEVKPGVETQSNKEFSAAPVAKKPVPLGLLAGVAAVLLLIVIVVLSTSNGRNSNALPTEEPTQPALVEEPTKTVATQTVAPTQTVEATATEEIVPTTVSPTETVLPTAVPATEVAPPSYFVETFANGIDPALWESFILGNGDPDKAGVLVSVTGIRFILKDPYLYSYSIYNPVTYKDVVIRLRAANVGTINENKVSLTCRKTGNTWYEYSVTNGGLWSLYYYNGRYIEIGSGATTALKTGQNINEYEMTCLGNEISLRVNGRAVRSVRDDNLIDGRVGFNISSLRFFPVEIEVKQFEVAEP